MSTNKLLTDFPGRIVFGQLIKNQYRPYRQESPLHFFAANSEEIVIGDTMRLVNFPGVAALLEGDLR